AAAEGDPPDPHRTRVAEPDPQAVGVGGVRELERGQAGLRPSGPLLGVDLDRAQVGEVDHDPAVRDALADHAVAAAADGELEPGLTRERDHAGDVHLVGDPDDDRRAQVEPAVEDGARPVVLRVVGSDHLPAHVGSELGDRDARRSAHEVLLPGFYPLELGSAPNSSVRARPRTVSGSYPLATQVWFPIFPTAYACGV